MSSVSTSQPQASSVSMDDRINIARGFGSDASFWQSIQNAMVITRREVRDSFRDWRIIVPIILLTLIFPFLANVASLAFINFFDGYGADGDQLIEAFLPLMPMIVGFFPVSISLVIALETFVGEKERRSLEPLLSTPLTNTELYMGKVLAATIPPLVAAYLGIAIYLSGLIFGAQQWRPDIFLVMQIVVLTTVQALVMVTGAVVISSQTTSTRAANLLASVIILPMSLLVMFESLIMVQPGQRFVLWWVIVGLLIVIVMLVRTGARIFNREELLGRAVDQLNFKWAWQVWVDQYRGIRHEERDAYENRGVPLPKVNRPDLWYRRAVFPTVATLGRPAMIVILTMLLFMVGGWLLADEYTLPLEREAPPYEVVVTEAFREALINPLLISSEEPYTAVIPPEEYRFSVSDRFSESVAAIHPASQDVEIPPWLFTDEDLMNQLRNLWEMAARDPQNFGIALSQNIRVLMFMWIIGYLSFGVLSSIFAALPFGLLGYALGNLAATGSDPIPFIMTILPHGLVEVPAVLIIAAVILRGASSVTGSIPHNMSVGEVWLRALADVVKVFMGLVFPMLILAATLEVAVTPHIVEWALEMGF